jgi:hypothetical protein
MKRNMSFKHGQRVVLALLACLLVATPSLVMAQSCSLCYTQAASSTSRFIQALRSGIIILMVPPAFLSVGITIISYRRRNQFHQPELDPIPGEEEDTLPDGS